MPPAEPAGERSRELDAWHMRRAIELAAHGQGAVEPNPMVGCVIARGADIIGEGWHRKFGAPHAEVEALAVAGRRRATGATLYVTLEPCCHHGKTPPCSQAILDAGVRDVVVAQLDPFPQVNGQGVAALRAAGVRVEVGVLEPAARKLNAPYLKLVTQGRPWVIAKWAMTLDGRIATAAGESRWISNEAARRVVHQLRGRMDAIVVGRGTAASDDPLLTARPPGTRVATRIVLDSKAELGVESQLARTAHQVPVIVAAGAGAPAGNVKRLEAAGCEVLRYEGATHAERLNWLLVELGRRRMTNVLVEGGAKVLGTLFDAGEVDEAHVFVAPRVFGGAGAIAPVAGTGIADVARAWALADPRIEVVEGDVYIHGHVARGEA
ncbi:MAG: bifunctional diaminohydroxyphosphoribosylaminopyrimidine deaminase/5-amino-6-(5-phosphoribosylamino)uracil reductase RibD [Planctomycetia bacterium]|nr:bifunctional diaminohydroxyphosphoribosylaminopyrimidine deaminase/5-amino-6-(5-phosphoribosylamino)uracil reductase RibD [Planctomycetia bacterium]